MSAGDFEGHESLVAQLRAGTLDAPDHLRRRVLAGAPAKRRRWAEMSGRRRVLVVVPIAATIAVGAAVVHSVFFNSGSTPRHDALAAERVPGAVGRTGPAGPVGAKGVTGLKGATGAVGATGAAGLTGAAGATGANGSTGANLPFRDAAPTVTHGSADATGATSAHGSTFNAAGAQGQLSRLSGGEKAIVAIPKGRLIHATAYLDVGVPNGRALTQATNSATEIVTGLGGYTQSSQIDASRSGSGRAFLDLRVPLAHTEVAIAKLGKLGRIRSQSVSTQDLEQQAKQETNQIGQLRRAIAIYKQALNSGTLSGSQRVDVQIKLANAEHEIAGTRKAHSKTVKSGTTAEIKMSLSTTHHGAVAHHHKTGRLGQLLHNMGTFIGLEGLIVLYALIVALPIVLLGALLWWFARGRRQRDERRLLASA